MTETKLILKCKILTEKEKEHDFLDAETMWQDGRVEVDEIAAWVGYDNGCTEVMLKGGSIFVVNVSIEEIDKLKCTQAR